MWVGVWVGLGAALWTIRQGSRVYRSRRHKHGWPTAFCQPYAAVCGESLMAAAVCGSELWAVLLPAC